MSSKPVNPYRLLWLLSLFSAWLVGCNQSSNSFDPPPPAEVDVAKPVSQSILLFFDENGETEAVGEVVVRARVKGFIESIEFTPGKRVSEGELLYLIEQDSYAAARDSAEATVDTADAAIDVAKAQIAKAKADGMRAAADLSRQTRLLEQNAGSQADYDNAVAANEAAKAAVLAADATLAEAEASKAIALAQLTQAKLDFDYTQVSAPIAGQITKTNVKEKNLVEISDELATIINRDQIYVNFSISDRQLLEFQKEEKETLQEGEQLEEPDWSKIKVYMRRETDQGFPYEGHLDYIDRSIDITTGTLGLRAVFDNPMGELFGGMFVNVRVPAEKPVNALLVPELAVGRDQQGMFVLAVNGENVVEQIRVSATDRVGGWALIESGIDETTRVIVGGLQRALPGSPVTPLEVDLEFDQESFLRGMQAAPSKPSAAEDTDVSSGNNDVNEDGASENPADEN